MGEGSDGSDASAQPPPTTLWLRIQHEGRVWTFELAPDEERAIVVGSLLRAHVRIDRRGIAPVHLHFEREEAGVRLIPGYQSDLCLNGIPVPRACFLEHESVVDFAGARLDVAVHHEPPGGQDTLSSWHTGRDQLDLGNSLADELGLDEPTRASPSGAGASTEAFAPLCDVHVQRPEARCPKPSDVARPPPAIVYGTPSDPLLSLWLKDDPTPDGCGSVDDTRTAGIHARPAILSDIVSPVAQLGVLSRRRPLLVSVGALCGSAMLALAMLALSRCGTHGDEVTDRAGVSSPRAELGDDARTAGSAR